MDRYIHQKPIGSHDLQILLDLLNQESLCFHKSRTYASLMHDIPSKHILEDVSIHHKQCFDTIHDYLNNQPF